MERFFSAIMRQWGRLGAMLELCRPWNGIVTGLFALLGIYISGGSPALLPGVMIFLTFTLAYMAGTILNDLYDENIDKINMPYRPLEENRVTKSFSWKYSAFLHILTLFLSYLVSIDTMFFVALFFIFSFTYSLPPVCTSRRGIIAQINLSLVAFLIPVYAGIVYTTHSYIVNYNTALFLLSMFSLFVFIFMLKDFKDVKGDRKWRKMTPVVRYGREKVRISLMVGTVVSYPVMIYSFSLIHNIDAIALPIFLALFVLLIAAESKILEKPERYFGIGRVILLFVVLTQFLNLLI